MSEWIYPDVIKKLRFSCVAFLEGKLSVAEVQSEIDNAGNNIVAIEEKWLRQVLLDAESDIELLIFTIDNEKLTAAVTPIVQNIIKAIS
ncbi:hypothetical protein ACX2XH_003636 [Serratia marcescens]|uniref:hypothetical protein n=1 Tax=Serratia TaxID=613 RepID=UPI0013FDD412|nr:MULTISPECIES: hypothetical protein [Serratia]MBH2593936.1 hypothetical protein [Serratia marcescens]MBH2855633.1 hypothetical protein [Serratia marcescens]MDB6450285.1 hypothetical protein [Serratia sp. 21NM0010]NRN21290.1 hypothetical protein [Serratia marcescens]NRN26035.1 hypothetical protein [Serratia marcescens]